MIKLIKGNANAIAAVIFLASVVAGVFFPDYIITDLGFTIAILITYFSSDKISILFGVSAIIVELISAFYPHHILAKEEIFAQHTYVIVQIFIMVMMLLFIKQAAAKTERDKNYYGSLFDNATEGILLVNEKAEIILANPATLKLFQYENEELIGKNVDILVPMNFRTNHRAHNANYFRKPETRVMGEGRDLFAVRKDGGQFPVEISLSAFKDNGFTFVIAFIVDITRRKEMESEVLRQRDELELIVEERTLVLQEALRKLEHSQEELTELLEKEKELSDIKSRFVSMASHEFRTPLSTVLSSAELIGQYQQTDDQPKRDRHIKKIKDSVHHLNDILEDFLSLGKLNEGGIQCQYSIFSLNELLESVKEEVEVSKKKGQQIVINDSGCTDIATDKKLLRNVLINLLNNALKYSAEGQSIWLNASCKDGFIKLSVRDEGVGIPDEDQPHLFSTFFRGKNVSNIQGTGLGLHIVKRYVDLLDGQIKLESKLEVGTTVHVIIPEIK